MRVCSLPDCDSKHEALGYCRKHYKLLKRNGTPVTRRHGLSHTPEYVAWMNMRSRCRTDNPHFRRHYKDLGIKVCHEWDNDFFAFLGYVGKRPSPGHSLDRINPSRGYEPGNVRWATWHVQGINQRLRRTNTTGYRGVSYLARANSYVTQITAHNQHHYIGSYPTAEEAALAYNEAARRMHGSEAKLNEVPADA